MSGTSLASEEEPQFERAFAPAYGQAVPVADGVRRVTVENPSPFTFHGTNTYLVGEETLAVIDPGPLDDAHLAALLRAIDGRPVSHILVSHTHRDHAPLARVLQARVGGVIAAEGPHRPSRPLHAGEVNPFSESADLDFVPDLALGHGATIAGDGWALTALSTPGHTANHLSFALEETGIVFSADHVMAWATSIVAPPDGSMRDYMASLETMLARDDRLYLPGHGGPVTEPHKFLRGLRAHRRMRERGVVERIRRGDGAISEIVAALYASTDPRLHGAAALSVLAHLEDLVERGIVVTEGPPALNGRYRLA
ncbi:glyoxylase-like metal-dependent hydrolase (beta-lactamase superfamily II) [Rhizobium sp. PP-F2F-G48]|uniref:MBL fold metallo-hydrolase n=1 Tax=Rhizobium sp. PP-F2F-G48 TaxID=2135651 RepID=UPI0010E9DE5E|nr:MBL fold metallo-hydrolase [Rhizobium sp. PP-F2F-G48]TCM55741.1 glyoxylase-like metal-dependent hydrolase (beta-lactamase superfamily II) [Rhizobium sp. PP-F2F-G48]